MKKSIVKFNASVKDELQSISSQMANHFESNIKVADLSKWLALVNDNRQEPKDNLEEFIFGMGAFLLPELINCKDKEARLKFLKTGLHDFFFRYSVRGAKADIADVGRDFLTCYTSLTCEVEAQAEFMKIFSAFVYIANLDQAHDELSDEMEEAA